MSDENNKETFPENNPHSEEVSDDVELVSEASDISEASDADIFNHVAIVRPAQFLKHTKFNVHDEIIDDDNITQDDSPTLEPTLENTHPTLKGDGSSTCLSSQNEPELPQVSHAENRRASNSSIKTIRPQHTIETPKVEPIILESKQQDEPELRRYKYAYSEPIPQKEDSFGANPAELILRNGDVKNDDSIITNNINLVKSAVSPSPQKKTPDTSFDQSFSLSRSLSKNNKLKDRIVGSNLLSRLKTAPSSSSSKLSPEKHISTHSETPPVNEQPKLDFNLSAFDKSIKSEESASPLTSFDKPTFGKPAFGQATLSQPLSEPTNSESILEVSEPAFSKQAKPQDSIPAPKKLTFIPLRDPKNLNSTFGFPAHSQPNIPQKPDAKESTPEVTKLEFKPIRTPEVPKPFFDHPTLDQSTKLEKPSTKVSAPESLKPIFGQSSSPSKLEPSSKVPTKALKFVFKPPVEAETPKLSFGNPPSELSFSNKPLADVPQVEIPKVTNIGSSFIAPHTAPKLGAPAQFSKPSLDFFKKPVPQLPNSITTSASVSSQPETKQPFSTANKKITRPNTLENGSPTGRHHASYDGISLGKPPSYDIYSHSFKLTEKPKTQNFNPEPIPPTQDRHNKLVISHEPSTDKYNHDSSSSQSQPASKLKPEPKFRISEDKTKEKNIFSKEKVKENDTAKETSQENIDTEEKSKTYNLSFYNDPSIPYTLSLYVQVFLNFMLVAILLYFLYDFIHTINADIDKRISEYSTDILSEIAECSRQYLRNNCMPGRRVPAMETLCTAWEKCMNRESATVGRARVSAETFSQVIDSFVQHLSFRTWMIFFSGFIVVFILPNVALSSFRAGRPMQPTDKKREGKEKVSNMKSSGSS